MRGNLIGKLVAILCGVILAGVAMGLAGLAMAGPKDCPDGHVCYIAIQNKTGKEGCFPEQADLGNGWTWTDERCGRAKEKKPTSTKKAPVITYTPKPKKTDKPDPEPTRRPSKGTPTPFQPDRDEYYHWIITPTPTYVLVTNLNECPVDCECLLVTQAVISNGLDYERNRLMETANAVQMTSVAIQEVMVKR